MTTTKILEAIADLEGQRESINLALDYLRKALEILAASSGTPMQGHPAILATREESGPGGSSYVLDAVSILNKAGRPLHINQILDALVEIRGERPPRPSVESSLIRHIAKSKAPKIWKAGPSTFGLSEWKSAQQQPMLVQIA